MTARERRREIRQQAREICDRYPRPARIIAWADADALYRLWDEHTGLIARERVANYVISEMGSVQ